MRTVRLVHYIQRKAFGCSCEQDSLVLLLLNDDTITKTHRLTREQCQVWDTSCSSGVSSRPPQTIETIPITLGHPNELDVKNPSLKTVHSFVTEQKK